MFDPRPLIYRILAQAGHDAARPIELLSLLSLMGWLQFLLAQPEAFALPRYAAFSALPPYAWAAIIGGIVLAQLVSLWPTRRAAMIRWVAMSLAAGIWTVIALSFWASADTTPLSARTNTVIAVASFITAVHLGLKRRT